MLRVESHCHTLYSKGSLTRRADKNEWSEDWLWQMKVKFIARCMLGAVEWTYKLSWKQAYSDWRQCIGLSNAGIRDNQ
jgi:hypothetical protein